MKEIKLMIDTSGLDQVQASLNRIMSELIEVKKSDADLIDEVDNRIDRIFDKLSNEVKSVLRKEVKSVVEIEFQKLIVKMFQDKK